MKIIALLLLFSLADCRWIRFDAQPSPDNDPPVIVIKKNK
jgi:hypothetical protein